MSTENDRRKKYRHPDLDDKEVENLAKYFRIDGYPNFLPFLKKFRSD
jgi:hypothetical protein